MHLIPVRYLGEMHEEHRLGTGNEVERTPAQFAESSQQPRFAKRADHRTMDHLSESQQALQMSRGKERKESSVPLAPFCPRMFLK
jgi:hypothetical protein